MVRLDDLLDALLELAEDASEIAVDELVEGFIVIFAPLYYPPVTMSHSRISRYAMSSRAFGTAVPRRFLPILLDLPVRLIIAHKIQTSVANRHMISQPITAQAVIFSLTSV